MDSLPKPFKILLLAILIVLIILLFPMVMMGSFLAATIYRFI